SSIMGVKGLARRGWLTKMGQKLYALSREGRRVVSRLLNEEPPPGEDKPEKLLTREQEKFLLGLLQSSAVHKFEENRKQDLTFPDACRFWNITENLRGDAVDEHLEQFGNRLHELDDVLSTRDAELSNGRVVTAGDLRVLLNIH